MSSRDCDGGPSRGLFLLVARRAETVQAGIGFFMRGFARLKNRGAPPPGRHGTGVNEIFASLRVSSGIASLGPVTAVLTLRADYSRATMTVIHSHAVLDDIISSRVRVRRHCNNVIPRITSQRRILALKARLRTTLSGTELS